MIPLIVIAGPTASGKTALSIELAKRLNGEIVSADSMQIYRRMNIGTAKPTPEEMGNIPHHLIDFQDPSVNFSVADYCPMAHSCIQDIASRGKMPFLVGGTGLYIDSVINGVDFGVASSSPEIREKLFKIAEDQGAQAVHSMLSEIDPVTALKYHPNNLKRVIRAIEFFQTAGETISAHAEREKKPLYDHVFFCINHDRQTLYDRINARVDIMLDAGLQGEVLSLLKDGCDRSSTAMQGIGYKEFFGFFDGQKSISEVREEIKQNSRRYAKRQLTWFRRRSDIHWLDYSDNMAENACKIISEHFKQKT